MTPDSRFRNWLQTAAWGAPVVAAGIGGFLLWRALRLPDVPPTEGASPAPADYVPSADPGDVDWSVFRNVTGAVAVRDGALSKRFRLAGTFFAFGAPETNTRKAVLADLRDGTQHIVSESDTLDGVTVVHIMRDRVVLRQGGREEELWLGFAQPGEHGSAEATAEGEDGAAEAEPEKENAFGGRSVGENQWVFRRDGLLDYYQQLLDDPERLVKIFDSMKPLRDPNGRITGYRLKMAGEADFYRSVGLREGDVVRKVNNMSMTSRRRAEYLIGEFVRDRANAFVFEIERNGKTQKMVYQVR